MPPRDTATGFDPQRPLACDKKVWDIADDKPVCVQEREMELGRLRCGEGEGSARARLEPLRPPEELEAALGHRQVRRRPQVFYT